MNSGPAPRVIVGMPVRNGARHLEQAIDSVRSQVFRDFGLFIADNGSTDATATIAKKAANVDRRIRYHRFDVTVDAAASFNRLLTFASGDYFIWMAHDDVWETGLLARLVDALDRSPDAALAFPGLDIVDDDLSRLGAVPALHELAMVYPRSRRLARFILAPEGGGKANIVHGLIRGDVARRSQGFRALTRGAWGQDYHLLFTLAAYGPFVHEPTLLFHKRASRPDPLPPLRERIAYVVAYLRIARGLRLGPVEFASVLLAVAVSVARVLDARLGLHFSVRHAVRAVGRRVRSAPSQWT